VTGYGGLRPSRVAAAIQRKVPVRVRLAALYSALSLASGAALLGLTYALALRENVIVFEPVSAVPPGLISALDNLLSRQPLPISASGAHQAWVNSGLATFINQRAMPVQARNADQPLVDSGVALAIMLVVAAWLGWLGAGRVLRPIRLMTARTHRITSANLHERLALAGPRDELTALAGTIDELLDRLEQAFAAQRRFAANASHELRTPLTLQRATLEIALADPDATAGSLRLACERAIAAGERNERLIEALLTLARGQRGLDRREPGDLGNVAHGVIAAQGERAAGLNLRVDAALRPAPFCGDVGLTERLVANLVDNALKHNTPGGWVSVTTSAVGGRAVIGISNSGPHVPADAVDRITQPFQRLSADRTGHLDGLGLGLAIVGGIAAAHDAAVSIVARPAGGLGVEVSFPALEGEGPGGYRSPMGMTSSTSMDAPAIDRCGWPSSSVPISSAEPASRIE
jgi:signal transduction histidine kinase